MDFDMLITGGRLFDPQNKAFGRADIAVADGRVARIAPDLTGNKAVQVINAKGLIVTPGLIDFHVHSYTLVHRIGIDPDTVAARAGTTTIEDMVFAVLFTASKLIAVGMSLEDALCAMTVAPARAMNRPDLADLKEGGPADISVLEWKEEDITFDDYYGHTMPGKGRLVCHTLVNKGEVFT